jgi:hypothetical protein
MISVVNGYVCSSSCDVEAAKKGKDPSAPPGSPPGTASKTDKTSGFDQQPVTVLDGALKELSAASTVTAPGASRPAGIGVQQPSVDLLA